MEENKLPDLAPPKEMTAMMLTLSVELDKMSTEWGNVQLRHATRRCRDCTSVYTCRFWLGDVHRDPRAFRNFCPNAGLFERFRGDRRSKTR
ncbi:MAG TPA: DUF6455 family protein [Candidatus Cybelea sp.]|nr:DUF6455 family protein [Candidatus Cybelea sp.]